MTGGAVTMWAAMSEREPLGGEAPPDAAVTDSGPEPTERAVDAGPAEVAEGTGRTGPADPTEPDPGTEPDVEVVDGFPVLAEVRAVERVSPGSLPAVQAAAAAGAGFVAGAATVALIRRRTARRVARNARSARRPADLLPIAATRSFLVDVHVIAKPE